MACFILLELNTIIIAELLARDIAAVHLSDVTYSKILCDLNTSFTHDGPLVCNIPGMCLGIFAI